jgi:5-methylcytosine-specific restriction endonuclease McrA
MRTQHRRTLSLNADYMPLSMISWQKALTLQYKDKVDIVDFYKNDFIRGVHGAKYPVPAVVRCRKFTKPKRTVKYSRRNVFTRDSMTCQYCGERANSFTDLTLDHVFPRSSWKKKQVKGTPTRWRNMVACCQPCNTKKAARTPSEAGMKLLNKPIEPLPYTFIMGLNPWEKFEPEWIPYLKSVVSYKKIIEEKEKIVDEDMEWSIVHNY